MQPPDPTPPVLVSKGEAHLMRLINQADMANFTGWAKALRELREEIYGKTTTPKSP